MHGYKRSEATWRFSLQGSDGGNIFIWNTGKAQSRLYVIMYMPVVFKSWQYLVCWHCEYSNDSMYFLTGDSEHYPLTALYIRKCLLVTHMVNRPQWWRVLSLIVVKVSVTFLLVRFLHLQKKGSQGKHHNSVVQYHSKHSALLLPCKDVLTDTYQTVLTDRIERKEWGRQITRK